MAGSQQQFDFPGADADAQAVFRYKNSVLRSKLLALPLASTGLTQRRWDQVREVIMTIHSYQLAGRQPELVGLLRTSGLRRDEWYAAREQALALGLIRAARRYESGKRLADSLAVDEAAIDSLAVAGVAEARPPTNADQRRPTPNSSDQRRPTPTNTKEILARAAKDLPINSSTTSRAERRRRRLAKFVEEVEEVVFEMGVDCKRLARAVRQAVRVGRCTREEILARVAWFRQRMDQISEGHRGGNLHDGLFYARRGMPVSQGWPHSDNFLEQEARRDRERKKRALEVAEKRSRARAIADDFARSRERERNFGPVLNAMSDDELKALERECFRDELAAAFVRRTASYRSILLSQLEKRREAERC
ncbi:MAG: hypothetical protein AB7I57_24380 [Pirellulales bacterium]